MDRNLGLASDMEVGDEVGSRYIKTAKEITHAKSNVGECSHFLFVHNHHLTYSDPYFKQVV